MTTCVKCLKKARFQEETYPFHAFCNTECQNLHYDRISVSLIGDKISDINILVRLPLKDLFQQRVLSLYYRDLIDNDSFFFDTLMGHYKQPPTDAADFIEHISWLPIKKYVARMTWNLMTMVPHEQEELDSAMTALRYTLIGRFPSFDPGQGNGVLLGIALESGSLDLAMQLLKTGRIDPSINNNQALVAAATAGHIDLVNLLLSDARVDPAAQNNLPLIMAARSGNLDVVNRLLETERVDPAAQKNAPIYEAAQFGRLEVVDRLLGLKEVDPTVEWNRAFVAAFRNRHADVVRRMMQAPAIGGDKNVVADVLIALSPELLANTHRELFGIIFEERKKFPK